MFEAVLGERRAMGPLSLPGPMSFLGPPKLTPPPPYSITDIQNELKNPRG